MRRIATLGIGVLAASGCGEVLPSSPDADTTSDIVRVTVLTYAGDGIPDPTAWMIFQDAEGHVVHEGLVDAMGKAEARLPMGGTVTEVRIVTETPAALEAQITTVMDVRPGDDLTLGFKAAPTVANQGGQTTMTASFTPAPGAEDHHFYTTCGVASAGTSSPVTLSFRDACHGDAFDLLVVASGGSLAVPQFISLSNVAYRAGQAFTVPGGYASMGVFRIQAMNVPPEISSLSASRSSMLDHAAVAPQTVSTHDPESGSIALEVPFPTGVGNRSEVSLTFGRSDALGVQQHSLHTSMLASGVEVDFARHRVPWLDQIAVTATGLTWATAVEGDVPDGMVSVWSGRWTDAGRTTRVGWRVIHPGSPSGIALPRLSPRFAQLEPSAQGSPVVPVSGVVSIVDYDVLSGYDELRSQADTLLVPSIDLMGAFVGMAYQRRMYTASIIYP